MKRILLFVVTSLCLFFVGCDNDDKDDVISLTPQELIQTTWDVELNRYTENGKVEHKYNPQIQISAESETKRSIFREKDKTKRSKKESAQHSKSRNKSFVMTSVSAL